MMNSIRLALVLCLVLAGLNIFRFYSFSGEVDSDLVSESQQTDLLASIERENTQIDKSTVQVIVEKPVFNPNRKPFVKEVAKAVEKKSPSLKPIQPKPESVVPLPELLGILKMKDKDVVFFVIDGKAQPVMLKAGDDYKGWKVTDIQANQVVLSKNDNDRVLKITWTKEISGQASDKLPDSTSTGTATHYQSGTNLKDRLSRIMQ